MTIHYEVHGGGTPALVFVHGWSCDRTYWREQIPHFADRYTVVAVDLAGHGESKSDRRSFTMPSFGADVAAVVEDLGLTRTVLIGHSMGGDVIIEAARQLPGRVSALVLVDVYATLGGSPRTKVAPAAFLDPFHEDFPAATRAFVRRLFVPTSPATVVDWVLADMSAAPPAIAIDALGHAMANEPAATAGLRELALPTLAINRDNGRTDAEALLRHGVRAALIPGVGHFPMLEDPATFNRLLDEYVAGL